MHGGSKFQKDLDLELIEKCQNINDKATIGELATSFCHCISVEKLRLEVIKRVVVKCGANPNKLFSGNREDNLNVATSAFHVAVIRNNPRLVALLLDCGANPNMELTKTMKSGKKVTYYSLDIVEESWNKLDAAQRIDAENIKRLLFSKGGQQKHKERCWL